MILHLQEVKFFCSPHFHQLALHCIVARVLRVVPLISQTINSAAAPPPTANTMRSLSTVLAASLSLCTRSCLGFHGPPLQMTRAHKFPKKQSFSSSKTRSNNHKFQPRIVATHMTKSEDEITEETKNMGNKSDASDAAVVSSGINGDDTAAAVASKTTTTIPNNGSTKASSTSSTGFSLILLPILLFKFTIVLLVKFATDIVVYPILYFYRMVKLGKRKISAVLLPGKKDGSLNVKVNGDSSTSSV